MLALTPGVGGRARPAHRLSSQQTSQPPAHTLHPSGAPTWRMRLHALGRGTCDCAGRTHKGALSSAACPATPRTCLEHELDAPPRGFFKLLLAFIAQLCNRVVQAVAHHNVGMCEVSKGADSRWQKASTWTWTWAWGEKHALKLAKRAVGLEHVTESDEAAHVAALADEVVAETMRQKASTVSGH